MSLAERRAAALTAVVLSEMPCYRGADLTLTIDSSEHERRANFRQRAITSPSVLDLLLSLPAGEAVPWQALTVRQKATARRAPACALRFAREHVTRLAVRPVRIDMATVRSATACRTALESAGRFAPICARQVIVTRRPSMPETLIEFDFWGIGLLHDHGGGELETLVEPQPWRAKRHTPAAWRFRELAYAQYLTTVCAA